MNRIDWTPAHELGLAAMDETHREFVALYNACAAAADGELLPAFERLLEHTVAHFDQEDRWMAASGFPPTAIHRGEHEQVLAAWRAALDRLRRGDTAPWRALAAQVPAWFDQHAATMDAALANWMRRVGYVPGAAAP